jgi:lipopolysaccharide transport system ATP-binding protein
MSGIAICVDHLGKRYRIGARQRAYRTFREAVTEAVRKPFRRLTRKDTKAENTIWALDDISFEVRQGEAVGIIGRNGAGKSTLLKILSRITWPTRGRVEINGRVGSLLEVGTGFHHELTGRENIYLNGAILGMSRREIDRKFDEIVAFSEIEKFLDTPVKFYSSGMYVRLAFAVAAHLEPEILVVDEVLAVGDAQFQRKCLGKMSTVAGEGRTVLFVSHNMGAIMQLCSRVVLLDHGRMELDGDSASIVSAYLRKHIGSDHSVTYPVDPAKDMQILAMSITAADGQPIGTQPHNQPLWINITYRIVKWTKGTYVCLDVFNESDTRILWSSDTASTEEMMADRPPGTYQARVAIPGNILAPGRYAFTAAMYAPGRTAAFDAREKVVTVDIIDGGTLLSHFGYRWHAATTIPLSWQVEKLE